MRSSMSRSGQSNGVSLSGGQGGREMPVFRYLSWLRWRPLLPAANASDRNDTRAINKHSRRMAALAALALPRRLRRDPFQPTAQVCPCLDAREGLVGL